MAVALFIKRQDLVRNSIINGNVDTDLFIQYIKEAQQIHVRNYLGTDLYNKISADIIAGTLSGDYLDLVNDYIQPMLIHYAMVDYLPFAAFQVKNGGVFKHRSENADVATKEEVDFITNKYRDKAEYYTRRFIDYMSFNQELFPEYYTNSNDDIHPDTDATFSGWVL
jgi:hypothetical protein